MIETTSLPSSLAIAIEGHRTPQPNMTFTFTGFIDEKAILIEINKKLKYIETSTDIDYSELKSINQLTEQIQLAYEEKEEVLTRIGWLQSLFKAKTEIGSVDSKEKVKKIWNLIAPIQTCPMKNQLLEELATLEASMPDETTIYKAPTGFELLMEKAIHEAGDVFINLGKAGREYVIAEVLKQAGDQANTGHVRAYAMQLEQRVQTLSEITSRVKMIAELEQLPLPVFSNIETEKKERIADFFIQQKEWTGLYLLDRKIAQLNDEIDKEAREKHERENVIDLPDGKAATTIDLRFNTID